LNKPGDSVGNN